MPRNESFTPFRKSTGFEIYRAKEGLVFSGGFQVHVAVGGRKWLRGWTVVLTKSERLAGRERRWQVVGCTRKLRKPLVWAWPDVCTLKMATTKIAEALRSLYTAVWSIKTGNILWLVLLWKSNRYYKCLCVCVRVSTHVLLCRCPGA
jgi:hypothetical protein